MGLCRHRWEHGPRRLHLLGNHAETGVSGSKFQGLIGWLAAGCASRPPTLCFWNAHQSGGAEEFRRGEDLRHCTSHLVDAREAVESGRMLWFYIISVNWLKAYDV